jgi:hypothetical protein
MMFESEVAKAASPAPPVLWRKAALCATGECIEVAQVDGEVRIRNSADPALVLRCSLDEWRAFARGIKGGDFDDLD